MLIFYTKRPIITPRSLEQSLLWNDPALNINWHFEDSPQLSAKDVAGKLFKDAVTFP